jgi:hypothetical protein
MFPVVGAFPGAWHGIGVETEQSIRPFRTKESYDSAVLFQYKRKTAIEAPELGPARKRNRNLHRKKKRALPKLRCGNRR